MDKTAAINPSNKAKLAIAVMEYKEYINQPSELVVYKVAQILLMAIAQCGIDFVLSEEG